MKAKILPHLPNLLTLLRLWLILPIVLLYLWNHPVWAAGFLVLSGLTDLADGFIARRFRLVSDVGKVLDPVADKLTQLAVLLCLAVRFPAFLHLFLLLLVKEAVLGVLGAAVIRRTGKVEGADWHGKVCTLLLYITMGVHFLWTEIPEAASYGTVFLCAGALLLSFALYGIRHFQHLSTFKRQKSVER